MSLVAFGRRTILSVGLADFIRLDLVHDQVLRRVDVERLLFVFLDTRDGADSASTSITQKYARDAFGLFQRITIMWLWSKSAE